MIDKRADAIGKRWGDVGTRFDERKRIIVAKGVFTLPSICNFFRAKGADRVNVRVGGRVEILCYLLDRRMCPLPMDMIGSAVLQTKPRRQRRSSGFDDA